MLNPVITVGTFNYRPTASCNHYRVGNKTHKVWCVAGLMFFRKSDAVLFANEFLPVMDPTEGNPEGAFVDWLISKIHTALDAGDFKEADRVAKIHETLKIN